LDIFFPNDIFPSFRQIENFFFFSFLKICFLLFGKTKTKNQKISRLGLSFSVSGMNGADKSTSAAIR